VPRKILTIAAFEGNLTLLFKLLPTIILKRRSICLILIIGIYLKIFMRHRQNTLLLRRDNRSSSKATTLLKRARRTAAQLTAAKMAWLRRNDP